MISELHELRRNKKELTENEAKIVTVLEKLNEDVEKLSDKVVSE